MKLLSLLAGFFLLLAPAAATYTKPPVNATCPIQLRLPDVATWKEREGGCVRCHCVVDGQGPYLVV